MAQISVKYDGVESGTDLAGELIWTNANPNNNFSGVGLTLLKPVTNYSYLKIVWKDNTSSSINKETIVTADAKTSEDRKLFGAVFETSDSRNYGRILRITQSTMATDISDCFGLSATTTRNNLVIPLEIYGIK